MLVAKNINEVADAVALDVIVVLPVLLTFWVFSLLSLSIANVGLVRFLVAWVIGVEFEVASVVC